MILAITIVKEYAKKGNILDDLIFTGTTTPQRIKISDEIVKNEDKIKLLTEKPSQFH